MIRNASQRLASRRGSHLYLGAVLITLVAATASAQTGTFSGTVASDTLDHGIANAELEIPDANLRTITDSLGSFEFSNVPPGHHTVVVRALGFQLLMSAVALAPGQKLDADIVMTQSPVNLATVHTTAATAPKRLPAGLDEMEARRKSGLGGYFVTDSMLRANDDQKLTYFLSRIPGLRQSFTAPAGVVGVAGDGVYLKGGRQGCFVEVFLDGALYFKGPASMSNEPPDFNAFWATGFSGVEYYPSGATVPAEYNGTQAGDCGTMLLWTRRTP